MSGREEPRPSHLNAQQFHHATGYSMSARGLMHRRDRVLLALDAHDRRWRLPGGTVRHRETPTEAVRRAIRATLGIEVEVVDFLGVAHHPTECCVRLIFAVRRTDEAPIDADGSRVLHGVWFRGHALPDNVCEVSRSAIEASARVESAPFLVTQHSGQEAIWQP